MIIYRLFGFFPLKDMQTPPLRRGGNLMKDAECAEWCGKHKKKFSDFYFSSYREIKLKIGVMTSPNDHNLKNKNRKNR